MKIRPVRTESPMLTDGQADMTKIIIVFRNFTKASTNKLSYGFVPIPPHIFWTKSLKHRNTFTFNMRLSYILIAGM